MLDFMKSVMEYSNFDSVMESVYTKKFNSLDDLCKEIKNPPMLMHWFIKSKVMWPRKNGKHVGNNHNMIWPDELIRTHIGNCWDIAICVYYFCKKKNYDAKMIFISWPHTELKDVLFCEGHTITAITRKDKDRGVYLFDYHEQGGRLFGPFHDYDEAANWYAISSTPFIRSKSKALHHTEGVATIIDDVDIYDQYYNKKVSQAWLFDYTIHHVDIAHRNKIFAAMGQLDKPIMMVPTDIVKTVQHKFMGYPEPEYFESFTPSLESMHVKTQIPKDSLKYRFDEWVRGDIKLLFITGLSGSGKSTLAQNLAKEFHCKNYEIDFYGDIVKKKHPEIRQLDGDAKKLAKIKYIIEDAVATGKRCIIEGGQIAYLDPNMFLDYSVIVTGTSFLVSTYRMAKRGFTDREREAKFAGTDNPVRLFLFTLYRSIPHNTMYSYDMYGRQKKFEKGLLGAVREEFEPSMESLLNRNDIYYRFDDWKNGKENVLFITGLSGSGKSTLGKKLANKYNAKYVEVDLESKELKKKYPELLKMDTLDKRRAISEYVLSANENERVVIDGYQTTFLDIDTIKKHAMIIIGAGVLLSSSRMIKRGLTDLDREAKFAGTDNRLLLIMHAIGVSIPKNIKANLSLDKQLDDFRGNFESYEPIVEADYPELNSLQNVFISGNDVYCNFKKFGKEYNVCFVQGYSGSGKSTLAQKIAKKYNATYLELDMFIFAGVRRTFDREYLESKNHEIIYEYLEDMNKPKDLFKDKPVRDNMLFIYKESLEFLKWVVERKAKHQRFVIEGVAISYILTSDPRYLEYPIVFKGTSLIKSTLRAAKREGKLTDPAWIINSFIRRYSSRSLIEYPKYFELVTSDDVQYKSESLEPTNEIVATLIGATAGVYMANKHINDKHIKEHMNDPATRKRKGNVNRAKVVLKDVLNKTIKEFQKKKSIKEDLHHCFSDAIPNTDVNNMLAGSDVLDAFVTGAVNNHPIMSYNFYLFRGSVFDIKKAMEILPELDKKYSAYDGKFGDVIIRVKRNLDSTAGFIELRIKEKD